MVESNESQEHNNIVPYETGNGTKIICDMQKNESDKNRNVDRYD